MLANIAMPKRKATAAVAASTKAKNNMAESPAYTKWLFKSEPGECSGIEHLLIACMNMEIFSNDSLPAIADLNLFGPKYWTVIFHISSEQGWRPARCRADLPAPPPADPDFDLVVVGSGHADFLVGRTEGSAVYALVVLQLRQLHAVSPETWLYTSGSCCFEEIRGLILLVV